MRTVKTAVLFVVMVVGLSGASKDGPEKILEQIQLKQNQVVQFQTQIETEQVKTSLEVVRLRVQKAGAEKEIERLKKMLPKEYRRQLEQLEREAAERKAQPATSASAAKAPLSTHEAGIRQFEEIISSIKSQVTVEQAKTPVNSVEVNRLNSERMKYEEMLTGWKAHPPKSTSVALNLTAPAVEAPVQITPTTAKTAIPPDETPRERRLRLETDKIRIERELKATQEAEKKNLSPDGKKAEEKIRKEDGRVIATDKERVRIIHDANPTGGCPMAINGAAVKFSELKVMASVRIVNKTSFTFDIETPSRKIGSAVIGLGPGCAVTLAFVSRWSESETEDIILTAISRPPSAAPITEPPFVLTLQKNSRDWKRVQSREWYITTKQ